jgi:hypothetical protein
LDLAARASAGKQWPDGQAGSPPADVVVLNAEDAAGDTLRPRLEVLGADVNRVWVLSSGTLLSLDAGTARLEAVIKEHRPALVVIDPLTAFIGGGLDTIRDTQTRALLLTPLAILAQKYHTAILLLCHLNKNEKQSLIYRASGSIAFVAAVRAGYLLSKEKKVTERRLLSTVKFNLGPEPPTLAFHFTGQGSIEWDEAAVFSSGSFEDAAELERLEAEWFLLDILAEGPVLITEVLGAAREQGLSRATVYRARARLGVQSFQPEGVAGTARFWRLPPSSAPETVET